MRVTEHLQPSKVFSFFEEICAIPHGSHQTAAISDYCVAFAKERSLDYRQDALGNITIFSPATAGYETAGAILLQGHLDMVNEKELDCQKNMDTEGLDLEIAGEFLVAKGTTLGGDNGIAIAMILALLDDTTLAHPPIEAVFTVDEEVGLVGAAGYDVSELTARRMINLDSEEEGIFTVSCAGGNRTACNFPVKRAEFAGETLAITVGGLTGGHSGAEIGTGRANANSLMGRVLYALSAETELRLVEIAGGNKDNAIPRECKAIVAVADKGCAETLVAEFDAAFRQEQEKIDNEIFVKVAPAKAEWLPMDADTTEKLLCFLSLAPSGVQAMSQHIPGLVESSLNLGVLRTEEDGMQATFSVRSCVASKKKMLINRLTCLTRQLGGSNGYAGDYPGWAYAEVSPLRDAMVEVYRKQTGSDPKIEAIHAGLECGLFSDKLPGLDCASIGPDLFDVHTPRERLSIPSVGRVWDFMVELMAALH